MAYTVLARRYRSKNFDEVVGQEPIARTLRNAIKAGRVAHAYLFCGTRGVGKTSMARIFANALNNPKDNPDIAQAIMQGRDTDVIEIDGASNNSVEGARDLIGNAAYKPLRGHFKIYIIDEVHMLSTAAFNALLKTMEEPPEHVKFILCTTEAQKVPATIQSRCQRYDFRTIATTRISEHLASVVKAEGVAAEPELLHLVARLGNGSMRDALSLLDRLLATGDKKLGVKLLEELLGLPDRELVGGLLDAFAAGDAGGALARANELLSRGISIDQVIETLLDRFRDLMVMSACGAGTDLVDLSEQARASEGKRAGKFDAAGLTHMIAMSESVQRSCKSSATPRALFDALIVRLAMSEKLADVTAVLLGRGVAAAPSRGDAVAARVEAGSAPAKKR